MGYEWDVSNGIHLQAHILLCLVSYLYCFPALFIQYEWCLFVCFYVNFLRIWKKEKNHTFQWLWKKRTVRFLYVQESGISDPLYQRTVVQSSCRSYLSDLLMLTEWKSLKWNFTLSRGRELCLLDGKSFWLLPKVWSVPYVTCCNFPKSRP